MFEYVLKWFRSTPKSALHLIHEAKEKRLTYLDLGNCGLTTLPDELFALTWLQALILAGYWWDYDSEANRPVYKSSKNNGLKNASRSIPRKINQLSGLKRLILAGNRLKDITLLAQLPNLHLLDLSHNEISDLSGLTLTALPNLNSLNLSDNQISDLNQLIRLKNIHTLNSKQNPIADFTPLTQRRNLN